jgi:hypothetical protein
LRFIKTDEEKSQEDTKTTAAAATLSGDTFSFIF